MMDTKPGIICDHEKCPTSVICCHQLSRVYSVGFIENNADPVDLQAWCYACEYFFQQEGEMTLKFKNFNNAQIVCEECYREIKKHHTIE